MTKLTDIKKLELLRELIGNSDYSETSETMEARLLNKIHRIVHPDENCPHLDWEAETKRMYKNMKQEKND